ncbi:MAG: cobaltochelatase subunit CobN, partial [bacterium]|nr:cobaltochelatase subunit CobN [bacterium]
MHLLTTQPGMVPDGTEALDLGQTPGDIIVLSAADTELAMLAAAAARRPPGSPAVRLASILQLGHHLSVDTYVEAIIVPARVVIVRLLGGASYWRYGIDEIAAAARRHGIALALLPGDDRQDGELRRLSTVGDDDYGRLWSYLIHGGRENADNLLLHAAALAGHDEAAGAPVMFPRAGYYWPGEGDVDGDTFPGRWESEKDVALVHFYRALVQAGDTRPVDALVHALSDEGLNALPLYSQSLKDPAAAVLVEETLATFRPAVIVNTTGFAVSSPGADRGPSPFDNAGCPILQAVFAGEARDQWQERTRGLAPRDIAMNVALPEVDGRILARSISFKAPGPRLPETETRVVTHQPVADRVAWTARLAAGWVGRPPPPPPAPRTPPRVAHKPGKDTPLAHPVG